MKTLLTLRIALLASLFVIRHSSFLLAQGSLTPPGAPAPTMKTLDQIEPRTPISSLPFTINAPGSYYLAGSLAVTSGSGITISADHVTLDLHGFTIASTASPAAGTAILINGTRRNVTIKNGQVRGTTTFSAGAFTTGGFLDGIATASVQGGNLRVSDVSVVGLGDDGIDLATNAVGSYVVERCVVSVCAGLGIMAGVVRESSVDTVGSFGIRGDVVIFCSGESVGPGTSDDGIEGASLIDNCRGTAVAGVGVQGGDVSNSTGTSTSGTGLIAADATNSRGTSISGAGLSATNALNCQGASSSGTFGLTVTGTASFCRGTRNLGTAINAAIAIGCTVNGTGTVTSAEKHLGTP
jgi:hypothetical protein